MDRQNEIVESNMCFGLLEFFHPTLVQKHLSIITDAETPFELFVICHFDESLCAIHSQWSSAN